MPSDIKYDKLQKQGLSQDLESGCLKLANSNCKILGRPSFEGGPQYTHISTINMYTFIKLRHGILLECQGNYMEMIKFNYMLEIDILRNSSPKKNGCPEGCF